VELRAKDFVLGVRDVLTETRLDPNCLELELTETFLMQDSKSTGVVPQGLKDMGVQLALDDFGTGYSSLSYLKRFPIDTVKIDQSFVRDVTTDADDASIVSAVISMGQSLHMRVVAEGVEHENNSRSYRNTGVPLGKATISVSRWLRTNSAIYWRRKPHNHHWLIKNQPMAARSNAVRRSVSNSLQPASGWNPGQLRLRFHRLSERKREGPTSGETDSTVGPYIVWVAFSPDRAPAR
jgi:sensor c-di-GMP phosphodiesterase-like protein